MGFKLKIAYNSINKICLIFYIARKKLDEYFKFMTEEKKTLGSYNLKSDHIKVSSSEPAKNPTFGSYAKYILLGLLAILGLLFFMRSFFVYSLEAAGYPVSWTLSFPFFDVGEKQSPPNLSLKKAANLFKNFGALGDYVGGLLNPIVALCALGGLLISIVIQANTLRATRSGLREQLDQENFFQLLANRENAIQNLQLTTKKIFIYEKSFAGRAAIREVLRYIDESAKSHRLSVNLVNEVLKGYAVDFGDAKIDQIRLNEIKQRICIFIMLYSKFSDSSDFTWSEKTKTAAYTQKNIFQAKYSASNLEDLLGHIFRATYQTLKFVYRSKFKLEKKRDLQNYLRAQMSEGEFALFALTAITNIGAKSRAVAIAFHLYQNRLLSEEWAEPLALFFDPLRDANYKFAESFDYVPLAVPIGSKDFPGLKDGSTGDNKKT